MSIRIEAPRSSPLNSQVSYCEEERKSRRRRFPRARGKGLLGQIGKWTIYQPACWLHQHSSRGEAYLNSGLKKALDLVSLIPLSLAGAPIIFFEASYVALKDKTWPFYALLCVGKGRRKFGRLKIKTMAEGADKMPGFEVPMLVKSPYDPRVVHPRLRRASLDELPQILNILRGEMAVVGPIGRPESEIEYFEKVVGWRPELGDRVGKYLDLYPRARPGMTGLYQIMGRANLNLAETALLEGWYLENASLVLDLGIIWGTLLAAGFKEGAY